MFFKPCTFLILKWRINAVIAQNWQTTKPSHFYDLYTLLKACLTQMFKTITN
ncbi:hypothetical protein PL9631_370008 [Planktothrix paucivesiculata PCC 9631]|uniref:Uncharacterized protein n=1 Tax=Planktothrix paucivesiculata PCC 9631 TaxID=671071 RepID=A0A7Z9DY94_9CYAN|nr:hypothetical protein PL9631_370008 [Planktothrix paucivesiculata PCC 9631]